MKFKALIVEAVIKSELKKDAKEFRRTIEKQYNWKGDKRCFQGTCQSVSRQLADYLRNKGYEAERVGGYYYPPERWFELNNEPYKDGKWKHWWVEVSDKWIVDVTADQFHPNEEELYRVVVKDKDKAIDYEF